MLLIELQLSALEHALSGLKNGQEIR